MKFRRRLLGLMVWGGGVTWTMVCAADAPPGHYQIGAEVAGGSVRDTKTGLVWQRTAPVGEYTYGQAQSYCAGLGAGWRAPSVKELLTIVDEARSNPAIDPTAFPDAQSATFWTSSRLFQGIGADAWYVYFSSGGASNGDVSKMLRVRCVR